MRNAGLFLVFGTLSADVQQNPRCLMVVNGMFSKPHRAGALEGHRSAMKILHSKSLFDLGFLLSFRLPPKA